MIFFLYCFLCILYFFSIIHISQFQLHIFFTVTFPAATRKMNSVQEEQDRKNKRQVLPGKVKKDVPYYA